MSVDRACIIRSQANPRGSCANMRLVHHRERTSGPLAEVAAALRHMAPPGVLVGARTIGFGDVDHLPDAERQLIGAAAASRRNEFAAGRVLARAITGTTQPILRATNGAPLAPPGWTLTIAHDTGVAVAAADSQQRGIGVDVEPSQHLEPEVAGMIRRVDDADADVLTTFVLKEATYKAWSTPTRPILEHHDVRLVTVSDGRFHAVVIPDTEVMGTYATAGGRVIALVVM